MKIYLVALATLLSTQAFAGGDRRENNTPPREECHAETTIDGAHNNDCSFAPAGNAVREPSAPVPTSAAVAANLIVEGTFVSTTTGQSISLSLVAAPVSATWYGMIYDIKYEALQVSSNLPNVKVTAIKLHDDSENVMIDLRAGATLYRVYIASRSHEAYNVFRESSTLFRLSGVNGEFVETFAANLDPRVPFRRVRSGRLVEIPLQ